MTRALEIRVVGEVQGVSFRAYAAEEAARLGVLGWVRNEPDGSVAAHLEGSDQAVQEMLAWCRSGPPSADVRGVEVRDVPPTGGSGFIVREH